MARYRKIDIRMWGDREVLRLSRPQPNGQSLWVYLLAGPATGIIPGAYRAREGGLADELGWSLDAFRDAFREVNGDAIRDGLSYGAEKPLAKADWEAGMVWVPNGIKHNPPTAPNTIRSWREAWDELPECDLKLEAYRGLKAFVDGMGEGFRHAFAKVIPAPSWMPSRMACAIQDQDQDQDQERQRRARAIRRAGADTHSHASNGTATTAAAPNGTQRVSAGDVSLAWHAAMQQPGGSPGALHALSAWQREFETIAAACNAVDGDPRLALRVVCEWFWLAPDGPVQSGRLSRTTASPRHLAKHISRDLDGALQWWTERKRQTEHSPSPEAAE